MKNETNVIPGLKMEPLEALLNHDKLPYSGQPKLFLKKLRQAVLNHPDYLMLRNSKIKHRVYGGDEFYSVGDNQEPIVWVEFHDRHTSEGGGFFFHVRLHNDEPVLDSYRDLDSIWFTSNDPGHRRAVAHCTHIVVPGRNEKGGDSYEI